MPKLICSATNCINNIEGLCTAKIINMEDKDEDSNNKAYCKTFSYRTLKNSLTGIVNMNIMGEIKQIFNRNMVIKTKVLCKMHRCGYNFRGECIALDVQIHGINCESDKCTECNTFKNLL